MPVHSHLGNSTNLATDGGVIGSDGASGYTVTGTSTGTMASYPSAGTGSGGAHQHGIDLRVRYVDVIIAAKN
jgi:hypothetical protein